MVSYKKVCAKMNSDLAADVLSEKCPSRAVLNHVTSRWGVLVLVALEGRTRRFSELRRDIGGVSERMLSQTLKTLEADGFLRREAFAVVPPHVEYSLTSSGSEVAQLVGDLARYIEKSFEAGQPISDVAHRS